MRGALVVRVHVRPSPTKPGLHTQVPPVHAAFGSHVWDVDTCLLFVEGTDDVSSREKEMSRLG